MDVILVPAGGGEVLAVPVPMRILEDGSNTAHRLGFIEARLPPGSGKPPQHIHREHSETFYVVSGTVRFTSADTDVDVLRRRAGDRAGRRTAHLFQPGCG